MYHHSRRDFLKTGLGRRLPAPEPYGLRLRRDSHRSGHARPHRRQGDPARLRHRTMSGRTSALLGQEELTRQVRYAYDHGIRFFETAGGYGGMHEMLGIALKGIPRDSYRLMSKVTTRDGVTRGTKSTILRKLANTDYFDIVLLHCSTPPVAHGHRQVAGRDPGSRSKHALWRTAHRCTGCRRCGRSPGISGSRSP